MKKFEFIQDYGTNKKGDVVDLNMINYHGFQHPLLMRGILKVIGKNSEPIPDPKEIVKEKLLKKKMKELRDFGKSYDAKDTNKEELVDEIIEKVPLNIIKKFLEDD